MTETIYKHRFLARITVEAETPLAIGNGEKDIITDALVAKDVNGLPYIPGTSLSGVIRHSLMANDYDCDFFGSQAKGSTIIFSDGMLIGDKGKAIDGIADIISNDFLSHFASLPIRQHVRINANGAAEKHGKFDEQIVFKGTRFVFDIEMLSDNSDDSKLKSVLSAISLDSFRIGSGTRCGFGELKVIDIRYRSLDLTKAEDLSLYIKKSSSLAEDWEGFAITSELNKDFKEKEAWKRYRLELKPTDFFLFSSGLGDDEADITPTFESYISWEDNTPAFGRKAVLIPATSVKGAIAHRTIYHLNRILEKFADNNDEAIKDIPELFGLSSESETKRGNILFSDIMICDSDNQKKIFNHVTIDRITGGTIEGHLFTEKAIYGSNDNIVLSILVKESVLKDSNIAQALKNTLQDLCDGLLPLGGGTNRGHGIFTGTIKEGE